MSGWYKQQRNIVERPWFKDADMLQLYTYLKSTAYVTDGKYKDCIIRRGSCPTTRSDMMEGTGMKRMKLDRVLKRLISYGEIIVKANNRFSIITICDYDGCGSSDSLFRATDGIASGITDGIASGTTHLSTIEYKKEDNLISPNSPYKKERELEDEALEAKKMYNKTFDGILPPCIRLSTATRLMVEECLRRFGRQTIDMVFEQIRTESFARGANNTGFIANFTFIFTPKNYQQYLERAMLRQKKQQQPQQEQNTQQPSNGSWLDVYDCGTNYNKDRYKRFTERNQ